MVVEEGRKSGEERRRERKSGEWQSKYVGRRARREMSG